MAKITTHNIEMRVKTILKDFTQDKELVSGIFNSFHKFSIDKRYYDEYRLIRFLFKRYLKFTIWDKPLEKVNWEIPFRYKGVSASVTHEKFGFRIYVRNSEVLAQDLFTEIYHKIDSCLRLIEPVVKEIGNSMLEKGEIIVENKFLEIETEFKFFLSAARQKQKKSKMPNTLKLTGNFEKINYKQYQQACYLADATYIAFFSLIEHFCILGLAFTNSPLKNIESFSKLTWHDKYKAVFPLSDPEFNYYYNKLIELAKYRRNPTAHGYLDKAHSIFHFYLLDARHRIPMGLYHRELYYRIKNEENLDILESFLRLIKKNKLTKKIIWYLNMGFDVYYETESLNEYQTYMNSSDLTAKNYLKYQARVQDDLSNMDW